MTDERAELQLLLREMSCAAQESGVPACDVVTALLTECCFVGALSCASTLPELQQQLRARWKELHQPKPGAPTRGQG